LFGADSTNKNFAKLWITDSASYHLGMKLILEPTGAQKQIGDTLYREFQAPIRDENWFVQTILGYGTSVLVSEPIELKNSIQFHLQSIAPSKPNLHAQS